MTTSDLRSAAETTFYQCLNLASGETCVIVTDDDRQVIGTQLYEVASEITRNVVYLQYPPSDQHGEEPPRPVGAAMKSADVFLAPTTKSLSHTQARLEASKAGARGATMPGITPEVFEQGLDADYEAIADACENLLEQIGDASEIRISSPHGTDITLEVGDRSWREDVGLNHEPGDFSNLPAGEVFISPIDANGTFVVDGTMMPYGRLDRDQELSFTVENGYVTDIADEKIRTQVESARAEVGKGATNLAELGIGANLGVTELVGSVLLDEKAAGTVHLAIGDDHAIGGDVEAPLHLDGILMDPTVYADGTPIELPES